MNGVLKKGFVRNRKIYIIAALILVLFFSSCGDSEKYVPESSLRESAHSQALQTGGSIDQTPEIFVQMGHIHDGYTANTVADFTPDGRHVLTGSKDGTVKLWETETGKEVKTFRGQGRVTDVVVSGDGRYVVIGTDGIADNLNLWEIESGKLVKSYPTGGTSAIAISPDGRYALVGDQVPQPKLWDLSSGELLKTFGGYAGGTITARTVGTNMLMTAHGYSNSASLWDYKNGVQLKIIKNDTNCLSTSASISDDGTRVAFGGYDMTADNTALSQRKSDRRDSTGGQNRPGRKQ